MRERCQLVTFVARSNCFYAAQAHAPAPASCCGSEVELADPQGEGDVVFGRALYDRRRGRGLSVDDLAERCACPREVIEWVDEGDVAVPVEALVYYAAAVGLRVTLEIRVA